MTSREARKMLLERISTDKEFYKSLKRLDEGDGDEDQEDADADDDDDKKTVYYDDIDSSKTISGAISDIIGYASTDCLADIYTDKGEELIESDAEDRGAGINLDKYTRHEFSTCDATKEWMEWDSR